MRSSRGCRCLAGPLPRSAVSRPRTMSSCCCSRAHLPVVAVHSSGRPASASPWPHARPRLCSKQPAVDSLPTTADLAPGGGIARSLLQGSGSSLQSQLGQRDQRLRVAVDVDEVLGRFLHSLNQFCHEAYGVHYDVADYFVYDFAKVWECEQGESNNRVHEFFDSHHFAAGIEAIPGALPALQRLQAACDLMVVTSRQHIIRQPTLEWLDQHYPGIFTGNVHFGNHFALEGSSRKKSEICRAVGADVLIDDNPAYAVECAQAGVHVLLYDWQNSYPWSRTAEGPVHDRITRVRDWAEVEQVLGVLAAQRQA